MPSSTDSVLGKPITVSLPDPMAFLQMKAYRALTGILSYCADVHPKYGEILGPIIATHPELCQVSILVLQQNGRSIG